jgi:predicted naringenin-chalcone synthase
MQILSAARAFPKHYYSQEVPCRALEEYWGDQLENPTLMRRLQVMNHRRPEPGTLGLLAAMGPGFCSELVLLQW